MIEAVSYPFLRIQKVHYSLSPFQVRIFFFPRAFFHESLRPGLVFAWGLLLPEVRACGPQAACRYFEVQRTETLGCWSRI